MQTFRRFLEERFVNLIHDKTEKNKYADDLFSMLQASYAKIGGIKGSGFMSPKDMVDNIPFWKLVRKNGKIVAASFYKDKKGRKSVAACTDGTPEGKIGLATIKSQDFERAYSEVSEKMLTFLRNNLPKEYFMSKVIPFEEEEKISGEPIERPKAGDEEANILPDLKEFFYTRLMGEERKTKLMMGTPGKKIY